MIYFKFQEFSENKTYVPFLKFAWNFRKPVRIFEMSHISQGNTSQFYIYVYYKKILCELTHFAFPIPTCIHVRPTGIGRATIKDTFYCVKCDVAVALPFLTRSISVTTNLTASKNKLLEWEKIVLNVTRSQLFLLKNFRWEVFKLQYKDNTNLKFRKHLFFFFVIRNNWQTYQSKVLFH